MNPRKLMLVTASLFVAATFVIGPGLSSKPNDVLAQMMQPGMMGPGMMW
jgi:hypothetical protein